MSQNQTQSVEERVNAIPDLNEVVRKIAMDTYQNAAALEGGAHKLGTDVYERHLPEHLNMNIVRDVSNYNQLFKAGTLLGAGFRAEEMFAQNDGVNQVTLNANIGRDRITHTIPREGGIVSGYTINGTGGTGGQYKRVVDFLGDLVSSNA